MMEKGGRGLSCRAAVCGIVVLLCATAFSCSLAAEFRRIKVRLLLLLSLSRSSCCNCNWRETPVPGSDLNRLPVGCSIRART